ncbi:MAG: GatB/YqeY domain-containing protein, partial [Desulfatiglandaceae bacterium]
MSLNEKIAQDLKAAIKAKNQIRVSCLRMLKTSVKNKEVENRRKLEDEEIRAIISSSVRKSKEAIEEFRRGNREDLALKETEEINILYEYLPRQLSSEEIEEILREIISDLSASGPKDLG